MTPQSLSAEQQSRAKEARSARLAAGFLWFLGFVIPPAPGPYPGFSTALITAMGWVVWLVAVGDAPAPPRQRFQRALMLLGGLCFAVLMASAALSAHWVDACVLALALAVFVKAGFIQLGPWHDVLSKAIVAGALVNAVFAAVQALFPAVLPALSPWLASNSATPGRAGGNLGQPNQLALLAVLALLALWTQLDLGRKLHIALTLVLGATLAWTGSRTGLVCLACVSVWMIVSQPKPTALENRGLVALAWFGAMLGAALQWLMGYLGATVFFASQRMHGGSDISSSRLGIWSDCWALLAQHPLTGVGWGELNYAWSLSDLPERGHALLGHAHNLLLQLGVELGVPLAAFVVVALMALTWSAGLYALRNKGGARLSNHVMFICLALLLLHSQLEYPLWYVYFLFPAAFWMGGLIRPVDGAEEPGQASSTGLSAALQGVRYLGALGLLVCIYALFDYTRVVQVYEPFGSAKYVPIESRVQRARTGIFFGHYADLAHVFTHDPTSLVESDFTRPMHHLINPGLLKSYAQYLAAHGQVAEAKRVASALKKYHSPMAQAFFAVCEGAEGARAGQDVKPFQCDI